MLAFFFPHTEPVVVYSGEDTHGAVVSEPIVGLLGPTTQVSGSSSSWKRSSSSSPQGLRGTAKMVKVYIIFFFLADFDL